MSVIKVLSAEDVERLFTIPMAIEAVERAYREKHTGQGGAWPMVFHEFNPGHADLDIKSGHLSGAGVYGLKVVSWFGDNPGKDLPALFGTSLIFDLATGEPKALLNAGPITDYRTGAAAAIGAKYLARPRCQNFAAVWLRRSGALSGQRGAVCPAGAGERAAGQSQDSGKSGSAVPRHHGKGG